MVDLQSGRDGSRRYRLLISLRAFADEQLRTRPDFADAVRAHTDHYLHRLAGIPAWRNVARDLSVELEPELDNLLLAVDRASSAAEPERRGAARRATEALAFVLTNLGLFDDARRRCDAALATELEPASRGRLLVARAYLEASEDGISDYVSFAGEALQYLKPGDGMLVGGRGDDVDPGADVHPGAPDPRTRRRRWPNSTATSRPAPNRTGQRCSST